MKNTLFAVLALLALLACNSPETAPENPASEETEKDPGDYDSLDPGPLAEAMFEAIGGREKWADLGMLYIRTKQEENGVDEPYMNELWRDMNDFKLRIEQQNDDFHRIAYLSDEGGWVESVKEGEVQELIPAQLEQMRYEHNRDFYVMLHRLAAQDPGLSIKSTDHDRVDCYENDEYLCSFLLDEQKRPATFTRYRNGTDYLQLFHFSDWQTTRGMLHPVEGASQDSSLVFRTLVWEPSDKSFEEVYELDYIYREE